MIWIEKVFSVLIGVIEYIFEKLIDWLTGKKPSHKYEARFISEKSVLSKRHKGFCINGKYNLSLKDSYQNALIIGGTGTGKSSVTLIPSIYTMQGSMIIHDPSGELFLKSSGRLKERGYKVQILNFADARYSVGFNPLARVHSLSDINKLASLLIRTALGNSKEAFWNFQATSLLSVLIRVVKLQESRYHTLSNVRYLLQIMSAKPDDILRLSNVYQDEELTTAYRSFTAYDEKLLTNIIATCLSALSLFEDDVVEQITSTDTLDLEQFRYTKTALFIQNGISEQSYYSPLTNVFFEQMFSHILQRLPDKNNFDIFFLIDECASLYIPILSLAVANVRKYRAGMLLVLQDFNQLIQSYGKNDAQSILSNCRTQLYFTGQNLETARYLEHILGKYQYEDEKGDTRIRPLMTADEIRTMKSDKAILLSGNQRPILANLRPYFKYKKWQKYARLTPQNIPGNLPKITHRISIPD